MHQTFLQFAPLLAAETTDEAKTRAIIWLAIIMLMVLLGGGIILIMRSKLGAKEADRSSAHDVGFSLSDLRAMRDRGEITPEEYEVTRARIIAKIKGTVPDTPVLKNKGAPAPATSIPDPPAAPPDPPAAPENPAPSEPETPK